MGKGIKPNGMQYNFSGYAPDNIPGKEGSNVSQENQPFRRRIDDFADKIIEQLGKTGGSVGDIYSGPELAGLYKKVDSGRAAQANQENTILEHQRLDRLEERALNFPDNSCGLKKIYGYAPRYVDSSGNYVYYKDAETGELRPLVVFKALYGYRFYDKKSEYDMSMYEAILNISEKASNLGLYIGEVERDLINAHIKNESFEIRGYTHWRIEGSDDYDSNGKTIAYEKRESIEDKILKGSYNFAKGNVVGPRLEIFSKKPVRASQLELLLKALDDKNTEQLTKEMEEA
ncbi:hypothetical protein IHE50_00635 [Candidatus Parvarchaeota archaeon]|uniref:Uncharacterized protein n=1 Tax=Candidatus Acidifodinimicrobium mancum TaxID=2898728 RepID=A0A8T3UQM6_9ARCH|nr:hypothetical protein [Candidatus Acidifodinimicrobium mancum]